MTQRAIDGNFIYFVTANVQNRRWFFVAPVRAATLGRVIQTSCQIKNFELLAYCILPNHVHILVRKLRPNERQKRAVTTQRTLGSMRCTGVSEAPVLTFREDGLVYLFPHRRLPSRRSLEKRPTLSDLMHSIKSTYSQSLRHGKFWQHRFYFRILQDEDYLHHVVDYIRLNYTKMNLPELYSQTPYVLIDHDAINRPF